MSICLKDASLMANEIKSQMLQRNNPISESTGFGPQHYRPARVSRLGDFNGITNLSEDLCWN